MSLQGEFLLYVQNRGLSHALLGLVVHFAGLTARPIKEPTEATAGHLVITTAMDCTPAICGLMAETGAEVLVLASFPTDFEHAAYLAAGAAHYLPMQADGSLLRLLESYAARSANE